MNSAVWLPETYFRKANAIARRERVTRATVLRRYVVEGIEAYEQENGPIPIEDEPARLRPTADVRPQEASAAKDAA